MTKPERLKQPDGPGWWCRSPSSSTSVERLYVWYDDFEMRYRNSEGHTGPCDILQGGWLRDTSEPPQEKPDVEWLDEPERAGIWCRLLGGMAQPLWVFFRKGALWYCDQDGDKYRCDRQLAKWSLIHYDMPEPPETKVELPELPTLRYARDKNTGKIISVVTWAKGEELSHSTHNGATPVSCSDSAFRQRYTWLTEGEVKECGGST